MSEQNTLTEIKIKTERVRNLMIEKNLNAILLSKQSNFQWISGGSSNRVILNDDTSLIYIVVTPKRKYLIATSSDAQRIMNEELQQLDFELVSYRWYDQTVIDAIKKIGIKGAIGSDFHQEGFKYIEQDLSHLRVVLTDNEILKLKSLSTNYTQLLTDFCSKLHPGLSEIKISGMLFDKCLENEIFPVVLMVGSDDRIFNYRHPVATKKTVEKYLLLATVVEKYGLNISISRSIYFGRIPNELKEKQSVVNYIEANYYANSLPGISLGNLFDIGKKIFREVGYPDEWEKHTLGGIVGYKPREFLVTEGESFRITENNALGWNPTIRGVKSEDMIIVKKDAVDQISIDENWPSEKIQVGSKTFVKPKILEIE